MAAGFRSAGLKTVAFSDWIARRTVIILKKEYGGAPTVYRLNADCGFRLSAENVHLDLTEYIQLKIHNKNRLFVSSFSWIWLHVHDLRIRGCGRFLGDRTERFSYVQS